MNKKEALNIVYELLLGEDSVLVQLRMGGGLNEVRYRELVTAIKILIHEYRSLDAVPKKLALAFVDISNYFYFNEGLYSSDEEDRLEDAVHEISQLANQLFHS